MQTIATSVINLLTVFQAAQRLGVNGATIRRWILTGKLPATRVGQRWRIAEEDLATMICRKEEVPRA